MSSDIQQITETKNSGAQLIEGSMKSECSPALHALALGLCLLPSGFRSALDAGTLPCPEPPARVQRMDSLDRYSLPPVASANVYSETSTTLNERETATSSRENRAECELQLVFGDSSVQGSPAEVWLQQLEKLCTEVSFEAAELRNTIIRSLLQSEQGLSLSMQLEVLRSHPDAANLLKANAERHPLSALRAVSDSGRFNQKQHPFEKELLSGAEKGLGGLPGNPNVDWAKLGDVSSLSAPVKDLLIQRYNRLMAGRLREPLSQRTATFILSNAIALTETGLKKEALLRIVKQYPDLAVQQWVQLKELPGGVSLLTSAVEEQGYQKHVAKLERGSGFFPLFGMGMFSRMLMVSATSKMPSPVEVRPFEAYGSDLERQLTAAFAKGSEDAKENARLGGVLLRDAKSGRMGELLDDPALRALSKAHGTVVAELATEYPEAASTKEQQIELAALICRNLYVSGREVTEASVRLAYKELCELRERYSEVSLFRGRDVLMLANNETMSKTYLFIDSCWSLNSGGFPITIDDHRFGKQPLRSALLKEIGSEGTFRFLRAASETQGEEVKSNCLEALRKTAPGRHGFTFVFRGHGSPDAIWLTDGSNSVKISPEEFAAALKDRITRFPELASSEEKRDVLIFACCHAQDFARKVAEILGPSESLPIFVAAGEFGQYNYSNFESGLDTQFFAAIVDRMTAGWQKERTSADTKTGGGMRLKELIDLFQPAHGKFDTNPSIFVPVDAAGGVNQIAGRLGEFSQNRTRDAVGI